MSSTRTGTIPGRGAVAAEVGKLPFLQALPQVHSLNRLLLPTVVILGFALRLPLLTRFPLREDEAIYGFWALHLWQVDPLALEVWPDKPPIFLWILGGFFQVFGASEGAARLVNVLADTLTIGLIGACAYRLGGRTSAGAAMLLYALNPFALSFAPTVYTDPLMLMWGSAALLAGLSRRWFWAGITLGAALMTKQQGLLFAPLIFALLFLLPTGEVSDGRRRRLLFCLGGLLTISLPILYWDSLRWAVAPSPWDMSLRNYGALTILPPHTWLSRLHDWTELVWYMGADGGVWVGFALLAGSACYLHRPTLWPPKPGLLSPVRLISIWSGGFFLLHIITSVQIWDRYLLPLGGSFALLGGVLLGTVLKRGRSMALLILLGALLVITPPALSASQGALPIGGDHGDYAGLTETFEELNRIAPPGSVLYHRSLGWHYRFYFFEADTPQHTRFELRWFPHTVYLSDNFAKVDGRRAFLLEPGWAELGAAQRFLTMRNLNLVVRSRSGRFTLYELAHKATYSPPANTP